MREDMRMLRKQKERGFTLIEALAAIFVIAIGLIAGLTLITRTIAFMSLGSARLTASYLAQEGIEIVRNMRDNNWLQNTAWDVGLDSVNVNFRADYDDFFLIFDDGTTHLNIDPQGFYKYDINLPESQFIRNININRDVVCGAVPDGCIKVTVSVEWDRLGETHKVEAQEYLYNWNQ